MRTWLTLAVVMISARAYADNVLHQSADRIVVQLNGADVDPSQWSLHSPLVLHFTGAACQSLLTDSTLAPSVVEP